MALVLAIDIRNTRTRIGLAVDGRLVSQWTVPTDSAETADGAVACVLGFFDALARNLAPIEKDAPDAIDLPESAPLADGPSSPRSSLPSPACGPMRRAASRTRARSP